MLLYCCQNCSTGVLKARAPGAVTAAGGGWAGGSCRGKQAPSCKVGSIKEQQIQHYTCTNETSASCPCVGQAESFTKITFFWRTGKAAFSSLDKVDLDLSGLHPVNIEQRGVHQLEKLFKLNRVICLPVQYNIMVVSKRLPHFLKWGLEVACCWSFSPTGRGFASGDSSHGWNRWFITAHHLTCWKVSRVRQLHP